MRHYVMTLMYIYWYNNVEGQIYEKLNEMISETMIPELTLSFLELKDWDLFKTARPPLAEQHMGGDCSSVP